MLFDLLVRGANLPDGRTGIDIACAGGKIVGVEPNIGGEASRVIDATGRLASPPSSTVISTWTRPSPWAFRA